MAIDDPVEIPRMKPHLIMASLVLLVLTAAVFWPAREFEFVNIDDAQHVHDNALVLEGISIDSLISAMGNTGPDYWRPISTISLMIDTDLYGVDPKNPGPFGYHQTNILLHALAATLLMLALHALTGAFWRSVAVAALFAVHPLRVESVAWITERKDVLSAVFAFGSLWAYAMYARKPGILRMTITAALLALGLMSKSILVTWPAVFLLVDLWPLRRLDLSRGWRAAGDQFLSLMREKTPLLVMAVLSCIITLRTGSKSIAEIPLAMRLEHVVVSYARYLGKILWPADLAAYYPYAGLGGATPWSNWQIVGAALLLLFITIAAIVMVRKQPYVLVGWLWFLGILVPVIGLVQVGDQGLADRFTYLPGIGVTIAIVWLIADVFTGIKVGRWIPACLGIAAATAMILTTRAYLPAWANTDALYLHTLAVTNNNRSVRSFYGDSLYFQKRHDDAIHQFQEAIRISPTDPLPHYKLGWIYGELGRHYEAQREFERSIELEPNDPDAHYNLAMTLWRRGLLEAARQHLDKAMHLDPRGAAKYADLRKQLNR